MKTLIKLLVIAMFVITSAALFAQGDPPSPNGDGTAPDGDNTPVGGRATVSGGMVLMLMLGAAYGGKKVYELRKKSA